MAAPAARAAPIGVIGVGNMGLAMAQRLLDRGHPSWARHPAEPKPARWPPGAATAPTARPGRALRPVDRRGGRRGNATRAVPLFRGAHARPARTFGGDVCSTIGPRDVSRSRARLDRWNTLPCIDAPMSGGPARARVTAR
jgi:3-hydroxyisobutyrate dehydrogenase